MLELFATATFPFGGGACAAAAVFSVTFTSRGGGGGNNARSYAIASSFSFFSCSSARYLICCRPDIFSKCDRSSATCSRFNLHDGQYQSPAGAHANGGSQQYVWQPFLQSSPSHNSMLPASPVRLHFKHATSSFNSS